MRRAYRDATMLGRLAAVPPSIHGLGALSAYTEKVIRAFASAGAGLPGTFVPDIRPTLAPE